MRRPVAEAKQGSAGPKTTNGSPTREISMSASRQSFEAEGMGFEPGSDFEVTGNKPCTYVEGQGDGAANALQSNVSQSQLQGAFDDDLQKLIHAWSTLPEGIRRAVIAIIDHS